MSQSERLSPPEILTPVYKCAEVIQVSGFTAGATVHVFANGTDRVGSAKPYVGWWYVRTRPLKRNEIVTAVQEIGGEESYPTRKPVTVGGIPSVLMDPLRSPEVTEPVYTCQQVVEATSIVPGAWVEVCDQPSEHSHVVGRGDTPTDVARVGTAELATGAELYARQVVCNAIDSPFTSRVLVQPLPDHLPEPSIDAEALVVGSNVIVADGLFTGAVVDIYVEQRRVGGGIAPGRRVIFPVAKKIEKDLHYWAKQRLCQLESGPSPKVTAASTLRVPRVRTPICPGSSSVVIEDTVVGALVKVYINGRQLGQATAAGRELLMYLGDQQLCASGDLVMATQEIGPTGPTQSATEKVEQPGAHAGPFVLEGHPFFAAAPGEQPIPGPVFVRGRPTPAGPGPVFRLVSCAAQRVDLTILPPVDGGSFNIEMVEGPKGHFHGTWDWSSSISAPPSSIPVGKYTARFAVTAPGGSETHELPFFVIFDPAAVSGPTRFVFDHTGVFFWPQDPRDNPVEPSKAVPALRARSYSLHLSDMRVFGLAMQIVGGQTDSWRAAERLLEAEHQRFAYDVHEFHGFDVLRLLASETAAQCYDDANMLTALLRASGIPAHPVTADARVEFHSAQWHYDTWVEARLVGAEGERWYALHSHQAAATGLGPLIRASAGSGWWEAAREGNDMIVMAGPDWVASALDDEVPEVQYDWNTPCKRPSSAVDAQPWIENLTDDQSDRYWSKPFWECSPEYSTPISIHLERGGYKAGELLSASVEVRNDASRPVSGELTVVLSEAPAGSKVLADRVHRALTRQIQVVPLRHVSVPFQFHLPSTLCADDAVMVIAHFRQVRAVAHVDISPGFDLTFVVPTTVDVGDAVPLDVTVTNRLDRTLTGVVVEIEPPFACGVEQPASQREQAKAKHDIQSVPPIERGATATVRWLLRALSPAAPAPMLVTASAPGAGRRRLHLAAVIRDTRPVDYVEPVVRPTYVEVSERKEKDSEKEIS